MSIALVGVTGTLVMIGAAVVAYAALILNQPRHPERPAALAAAS